MAMAMTKAAGDGASPKVMLFFSVHPPGPPALSRGHTARLQRPSRGESRAQRSVHLCPLLAERLKPFSLVFPFPHLQNGDNNFYL